MKNQLKPGDIGLVRNKGFVPKAIRFFMNMYRASLNLPRRVIYNHAFTVINVWGHTYAAEALKKGFTIRPISAYYNAEGELRDGVKIKTPKRKYTKKEQELISKEATKLTFSPTRYDFFNFFYQMGMIVRLLFTKGKAKWDGPVGKKATKRLYCSEAAATLSNIIRPDTFKLAAATNPLDIDINKYYKDFVKHDNKRKSSKKTVKKV